MNVYILTRNLVDLTTECEQNAIQIFAVIIYKKKYPLWATQEAANKESNILKETVETICNFYFRIKLQTFGKCHIHDKEKVF